MGLEFTANRADTMTLPLIAGKPALIGAITAGVVAVVWRRVAAQIGLTGRGRRRNRRRDEHGNALERHEATGRDPLSALEILLVIVGLTLVTILGARAF